MKDLHRVTNHPVHIIDDKGALSPSSFIPFCSFGEDMDVMGTKLKEFEIPICNSFRAKIKRDQLCYELDLQKLKNNSLIKEQLQFGLFLVLDYNEDRQLIMKNKILKKSEQKKLFDFQKENIGSLQAFNVTMLSQVKWV